MGNIVLLGDFNAHTSVSDIDFVLDYYEKDLEDILPTSHVTDSVLWNRNSVKSDVKTDDYGRLLLDLCISCQCRMLNGRTLSDTVGNFTSFLNIMVVQPLIIVLLVILLFMLIITK